MRLAEYLDMTAPEAEPRMELVLLGSCFNTLFLPSQEHKISELKDTLHNLCNV